MTFSIVPGDRMRDMLGALSPAARGEAERAGAYSLYALVRSHVRRVARRRHATSSSLGAEPTRHLEEGARAIVPRGASVDIPIPGFSRVFHAVEVRPRNARALTIPISRIAYGKRAPRLASEGWRLFRVGTRGGGPGAGVLFGARGGGGPATALYLLRAKTVLPQDRSLLPGDEEMQKAAAGGVARAILRRNGA